jgi:hypothetical protein
MTLAMSVARYRDRLNLIKRVWCERSTIRRILDSQFSVFEMGSPRALRLADTGYQKDTREIGHRVRPIAESDSGH